MLVNGVLVIWFSELNRGTSEFQSQIDLGIDVSESLNNSCFAQV